MINAIIIMIVRAIKEHIMLKKCLIPELVDGIEAFERKGKLYDRNKFIELKSTELLNSRTLKLKDLERQLKEYEEELPKCECPYYYLVLMDAYKVAISELKS